KAESKRVAEEAAEFYRFGFDLVPISAEHGTSVGDLLGKVLEELSFTEEPAEDEAREIRLAVIGRPNVGKSSIVNKLLGEERVIV
ncbi:50S ribosome-binding GTPase, partial [Escherichia coli]|nr:50S ribosome-binding GTPase [Escherichia coli]